VSITQQDTFALMERLRARGDEFCVVTVVRTADATSAKAGAKAIVTADGELHGFVGGACVTGATCRVALEVLEFETPRLIRVRPGEEVSTPVDGDGVEQFRSGCPSGGTVDLFLEPVRQQIRLVVCGASPVAVALVRLAAGMGYRLAVAAPGVERKQVPGADAYHDGFDLDALAVRAVDAVVVATQGRRDRDALAGALATPAGYVGMVGSRRKVGVLLQQLEEQVPVERLSALRGPAGLDIGAIEPEEIALSILGEIVQVRRHALRQSVPQDSG
jgi:xanthine dehydrogenase accessory factor